MVKIEDFFSSLEEAQDGFGVLLANIVLFLLLVSFIVLVVSVTLSLIKKTLLYIFKKRDKPFIVAVREDASELWKGIREKTGRVFSRNLEETESV